MATATISATDLSAEERAVLSLLTEARGASRAVSIDAIRAQTGMSYRAITTAVESLRTTQRMPIGSARGDPHGYFLIVSADDLETTVRPLKHQALSMLRVVSSLEGRGKSRLGELLGQLTIELNSDPDITEPKAPPVPARVRGTETVIFAEAAQTDPCWHCHSDGVCSCALCAERASGLTWRAGRCGACLGTCRLTWLGGIQ